jgi:hypothetical protein
MYNPGPVASEAALSRIIGFRPNPIPFKWTKRKTSKIVRSIENGEIQYEDIENMAGCTVEHAKEFLDQYILENGV